MQYTQILEVYLALMVVTALACLVCLASRWFYKKYLGVEENKHWKHTTQMGSYSLRAARFLVYLLALAGRAMKTGVMSASLLLRGLGGTCLGFVQVFWVLMALPLVAGGTCILMVLTCLSSVPGVLYGLCWATSDAADILVALVPSHTFGSGPLVRPRNTGAGKFL